MVQLDIFPTAYFIRGSQITYQIGYTEKLFFGKSPELIPESGIRENIRSCLETFCITMNHLFTMHVKILIFRNKKN